MRPPSAATGAPPVGTKPAHRMKIACSSASFGAALDAGELTQLEWLDLCANELEVDGVVFDARHFPRTDDEYLAQLLKTATDLGLGIAGLSADSLFDEGAPSWLETAKTLRAPLVLARAPAPADDAAAWTRFSARAKAKAGEGKALNVTLALRNAPATLCANAADLRALAKDVDSAWLRFALDLAALESSEAADALLSKTAIAVHDMRD